MSTPEEPRFACVGCGALNPVGAEVCSGCGHRFAGPPVGTPSPAKSGAAPISPGRGMPIRRGGGVVGVAKVAGGIVLVLLSSAIAFVATCFPIGLMNFNENGGGSLNLALVVGVGSAVVAGGFVAYLLDKGRRRRAAKGRSTEDRP